MTKPSLYPITQPITNYKKTNEKRHHKATGHLTKDMVHIPNVRSNKDPNHVEPATPIDPMHEHEDSLFEDTPIYSLLYLAFILVFGFPLYLLVRSFLFH